jgi:hypothetical protein
VGNRFVVFHGFHGTGFSTALFAFASAERLLLVPGGRIAADHVRAEANRHASIQVFVDRLPYPCQDGQKGNPGQYGRTLETEFFHE